MTVNYRQIPELLRARKPFRGNSMSAKIASDDTYIVLSYRTVIATAKGSEVTLDGTKYSQTTSRHQSLCRENLS